MTDESADTLQWDDKNCRHILSLSGGKDSTALALYMRYRIDRLEFIFCDTEKELPETYQYLEKLEVYLDREITRIKPEVGFDDLLEQRRNFLPSPQVRWCTEYLKIRPFEKYVGHDSVVMYIGIRADEANRKGYISTKPNIRARFPFVEDGLRLRDIEHILRDSGLGLPDYYKWRSRSGCFFCFYQQRREWVGLWETHKKEFNEAMQYERQDPVTGELYTWIEGLSLGELKDPARVAAIKADYLKRMGSQTQDEVDDSLRSVFSRKGDDGPPGCTFCHL